MKGLIFLFSFLCSNVSFSQKPAERVVDCGMLKTKHNFLYYKDEKTPYSGKCTLFYQNGKKSAETSILNGRYEGQNLSYYENGQKYRESHYKQGVLDGAFTVWYLNGHKKAEISYKNGRILGEFIKWDYKGNNIYKHVYTLKNQKEHGKIDITSEADVFIKREKLIKYIWGRKPYPLTD